MLSSGVESSGMNRKRVPPGGLSTLPASDNQSLLHHDPDHLLLSPPPPPPYTTANSHSSLRSLQKKLSTAFSSTIFTTSSALHGSVLVDGGKVQMRREINLLYAVSLLTGIIIGSGIFVSPVSIVANCGSIGLSLVVWVVSGLLTTCIALSYAELAGMIPSAGGEYSYFREVISDLAAFLHAWMMLLIINPSFYAVLALTTSNYIFKPFFPDCDTPPSAVIIFAVWILGMYSSIFAASVLVN